MARISEAVRKGANAYLKRQYSGVAIFFIAVFFVFYLLWHLTVS